MFIGDFPLYNSNCFVFEVYRVKKLLRFIHLWNRRQCVNGWHQFCYCCCRCCCCFSGCCWLWMKTPFKFTFHFNSISFVAPKIFEWVNSSLCVCVFVCWCSCMHLYFITYASIHGNHICERIENGRESVCAGIQMVVKVS